MFHRASRAMSPARAVPKGDSDQPGAQRSAMVLGSVQADDVLPRIKTNGSEGSNRSGAARLLAVTSVAHFLNDGVVFFVPVIGDLLSQDHHTSTIMVTAMLTTFYVVSAGFGIAVGLVADKIGRRGQMIAVGIAVLGISLVGFYASLSVSGISSDVLVIVAAIVAGLGSAFYHPLGGSVLQLGFPADARGKVLGINGAFGSLGRALYPALFFVIAALGISRPTTTLVFAVLSLLAAVIVVVGLPTSISAPREQRSVPDNGGSAPAAGLVKQGDPIGPKYVVEGSGADDPPPMPRPSLLTRSVLALTTIAFFRSLGFIGIVSWVPIYLTTQRHAGLSTDLGMIVTVMYAGGIIGQPLFGLLADQFDKRFVLALDSLGSAGGIFFFLSTTGQGPMALLALAVFGMFTFSGFPLLLSLVADYVPKRSSTTGNAVVWGVGSTGGQALGPVVVSLITGGVDAHLGVAFAILGGVVAATVLATPLLGRPAESSHMALFG